MPTVPGEVVAPGERARLPRRGDVFVGPAVDTGTRRFGDRNAATAYIARSKRSVFVQPAIRRMRDGADLFGRGAVTAFPPEPDFELWDVGAAALAAAAPDPT